jgi:hypothetical protein
MLYVVYRYVFYNTMKKLLFLLIFATHVSFVSAQTVIDTVFVIEDTQFELWVRGFEQTDITTTLVIDLSNGNQVTLQKGIDKPLIIPFSINQEGFVDFTWYVENQKSDKVNIGTVSVIQHGVLLKELYVQLQNNKSARFVVLPLRMQEAFRSP